MPVPTSVAIANLGNLEMKKVLLGTTALLGVGTLAGGAMASDGIKLDVGGFFRTAYQVNFDDNSRSNSDGSGADLGHDHAVDGVFSDAEIHFTGEITLVDGATVDFSLTPATGIAGLYTMTMFPGGRVEGMSERGATLTGQLTPGAVDEEHGRFSGTFTAPDTGETRSFDYSATAPGGEVSTSFEHTAHMPLVSSGNARLVVLADGQFRGGAKQKGGNGFSWPCID